MQINDVVTPTPSLHVLRSALRAGRLLDSNGTAIADARESYIHVPTGGLYHFEDLISGERLLARARLLREEDERLFPTEELTEILETDEEEACRLVLWRVLYAESPLWFNTAVTDDGVAPEFVPDQDLDAISQTVVSPEEREAFLLTLGRRFDATLLAEEGAAGEEEVVDACRAVLTAEGRSDLAREVRRVSLVSDQLGYDVVTPTLGGSTRRLEVKTTRREGLQIEIFLSRNEANVAQRDTSWCLVACRMRGTSVSVLGWCSGAAVTGCLPRDVDPRGRWASALIRLPTEVLTGGVPVHD